MKFSQRIGKKGIRETIQIDGIDSDLSNRLWNVIIDDFIGQLSDITPFGETQRGEFCAYLWKEYFNYPIDTIPSFSDNTVNVDSCINKIREWYFKKADWFEIYDFIELIAALDEDLQTGFLNKCNKVLEKEMSAYRIVGTQIIPMTSEQEIEEIELALSNADRWHSVNVHLQTAIKFLADRKNPNFRNSIKESISAVESFCIIITGDKKATLGNALTQIEKKPFIT